MHASSVLQVLLRREGQGDPAGDRHDAGARLQPQLRRRFGRVAGLEAAAGGHHLRDDPHGLPPPRRRPRQGRHAP